MTNEEEERSKFAKYLGLYLNKFQEERYRFEKGGEQDIFWLFTWPFKFVWSILASLWQIIFGERR